MCSPPLFVLAGGFGTRLNSVLRGLPKALAPILGRPFLALQIENWVAQGCTSFVFLLHHNANIIIDFLVREADGLLKGCDVRYVVEPEPLGTGGSIAYAIKQLNINSSFLVINADTWVGSGIPEIMMVPPPAISVIQVHDVGRYGEVEFNHHGLITRFLEKGANSRIGWVNAGLSHLHSDQFIKCTENSFSLEQSIYPDLVNKRILRAVILDTDFIDIGVPEDYERFCERIILQKNIS